MTDEERLSDTSEKRASKFFNRALPDPPSVPSLQTDPSTQKITCPDELNNLYELISQSTPEEAARTSNAGEMYEDIDNCLERCGPATVSGLFNDSSSSCRSSISRSSSLQHPTRRPQDEEYLEPVLPPEEEPSNWRPLPAPRSSISNLAEGRHQTSYVNAEMMSSTELPSLDDGFAAMTEICRDALKQIADRITVQYLSASWPSSCPLAWSNFELFGDGQPQLVQQNVSYYCARHSPLAPKGCVLMVFKTWPQRPLTAHQHPNVVSPLATFHATHLSTGTCTDYDNVAVLSCTRVADFHQYWRDQHGCSSSALVEQAACLTLARLLSAAIYLHGHDAVKPRLMPRRVVMTILDTGECYPLLRPTTRVSDNSGTVADDVAELVTAMLQLDKSDCTNVQRRKSDGSVRREKPTVIDAVAAFPTQSPYSRCLQRVVRYLRQTVVGDLWDEGLKRSLNLLEFTLWGPSEDDARMIAISDGRDTALQVWLSVTRCRMLAESALVEGTSQSGLEFAERAAFLCSATENSLLEITKLLFA